jgi:two-component system, OmpR family, response regulator ResD
MLLRIAPILNMSWPWRVLVGERSVRRAQKLQSKGRGTSSIKQQSNVTIGPLTIDKARYQVQLGNRSIHLTPRELALLCALAACPGRVYRREELLHRVWGEGINVEIRTVDADMSKLRHKLRTSEDSLSLAETVWGIGYRLRDPST